MKTVYVFPHTHWDYEWYFSINESTVLFSYHMDDVINELTSGRLKTYTLDGQFCILEEYLRIFPNKYECVKELVKSKKLIIGPWYTQTDEMIIRGESIIRNLQIGIRESKELGNSMMVGYLPDSFGQSINMPKIYNGFGIESAIFWRGVDDVKVKQREFIWSSDQNSVVVYNIKNGYFFGGEFWMKKENIADVEKTFLNKCNEDIVLLPVGSDQRKVDKDYNDTINYYNQNTKQNLNYVDSNPEEFMNLLSANSKLPVVQGEFLEAQDSKIHRSIYSNRYDHKYLNDKVERRLINQLEPLLVYANYLGMDLNLELLDDIWKTLLKSHAHDSACGCNTDKTNNIILNRLKSADELSYSMEDYILRKLVDSCDSIEEYDVTVFPSFFMEGNTILDLSIVTQTQNFKLLYNNKKLKYTILSQEKVYYGSIKRDKQERDPKLYFYKTNIKVEVGIDPLTPQIIKVIETYEDNNSICDLQQEFIENEFYKLKVQNDKLQLYIKQSQKTIEDFIYVMDDADDGDTYDFSNLPDDTGHKFLFGNSDIKIVNNGLEKFIEFTGFWKCSAEINAYKNNQKNKLQPFKLKLELGNNEIISGHLEIDNNCKDHRMRLMIKTGLYSEFSYASTPMGEVIRENESSRLSTWRKMGYKEEPTAIYPMLDYCSLADDKNEVCAISKGIKEYQIIENNIIGLTLFRSVGFLGKPDLLRRPGIASGNQYKWVETPDSQLQKRMKFKFGIQFSENSGKKKRIDTALKFTNKIMYYQKQDLDKFTNTLQYFEINKLKRPLKLKALIKAIELNALTISAIQPIKENQFIIRLINHSSSESTNEKIIFTSPHEYSYADMSGNIKSLTNIGKEIKIKNTKPGEIINVLISIK